jgi:hypothetical protein
MSTNSEEFSIFDRISVNKREKPLQKNKISEAMLNLGVKRRRNRSSSGVVFQDSSRKHVNSHYYECENFLHWIRESAEFVLSLPLRRSA